MNQTEYDIYEFLVSNRDTIVSDLKHLVNKFKERKTYFNGIYKLTYEIEFKKFVLSLLKLKINENFNLQYPVVSSILDETPNQNDGVLSSYYKEETYND